MTATLSTHGFPEGRSCQLCNQHSSAPVISLSCDHHYHAPCLRNTLSHPPTCPIDHQPISHIDASAQAILGRINHPPPVTIHIHFHPCCPASPNPLDLLILQELLAVAQMTKDCARDLSQLNHRVLRLERKKAQH